MASPPYCLLSPAGGFAMSRKGGPPPRCGKCGDYHWNYIKCAPHEGVMVERKMKLYNKTTNTRFLFDRRSDVYGRTPWVPGDLGGYHVNEWKGK